MAELRKDLESLGFGNVRTLIQSGNAVFESAARTPPLLASRIAAGIEKRHGFRPEVVVLRSSDLRTAIDSNPFPDAVSQPQSLHFFFLSGPAAKPDLEGIARARAPSESCSLTPGVFYLHAPDGTGRSALAAKAEKLLGVPATARNFRTVDRLWRMATQSDG